MFILLSTIFQLYHVIKFVSDLRQFGSFLCVLRFHPPLRLTVLDIDEKVHHLNVAIVQTDVK